MDAQLTSFFLKGLTGLLFHGVESFKNMEEICGDMGTGIIPTKEQRFSITSYISLKGVTYVFCIHKSLHNRMVYLFTKYMKMSHQLFVELSFEGWPLPNFKQKISRYSTCWTHASSSNCRRHWSQHPKTHGLSEPKAPTAPQKICIYLAKL